MSHDDFICKNNSGTALVYGTMPTVAICTSTAVLQSCKL
uniref:Uncharacterized protein n=1 Tax=Arundo donax TaxID=35708 RepID=A0A0A9CKJ1_ARUDO